MNKKLFITNLKNKLKITRLERENRIIKRNNLILLSLFIISLIINKYGEKELVKAILYYNNDILYYYYAFINVIYFSIYYFINFITDIKILIIKYYIEIWYCIFAYVLKKYMRINNNSIIIFIIIVFLCNY